MSSLHAFLFEVYPYVCFTVFLVGSYSVYGYLDKVRLLTTSAKDVYGQQRNDLISQSKQALDRGLVLDPNWRNPCWGEMFDLLRMQEHDAEKCKNQQTEIIEKLKNQNPFSTRVLIMRQLMLQEKDGAEIFENLLNDINEARDRAGVNMAIQLDVIKLKVLAKLGDIGRLENAIEVTRSSDNLRDENLAMTVASILRDTFAKDRDAITVLLESLRFDFNVDVFFALFHIYIDLKDQKEADLLYEKWHRRLSNALKNKLRIELLDMRENFEESLKEIQRYEDETGIPNIAHRIYLHLRLKHYQEVEKLARSVLEPIHYSPEAASETVNLELARKMQGKKVDAARLEAVMKYNSNPSTHAAIYALLSKKAEMLDSIKKTMKSDKKFRFTAAEWPVFSGYRNDQNFSQAISP